jgi:hypothetical protein
MAALPLVTVFQQLASSSGSHLESSPLHRGVHAGVGWQNEKGGRVHKLHPPGDASMAESTKRNGRHPGRSERWHAWLHHSEFFGVHAHRVLDEVPFWRRAGPPHLQ